MWVTPPGNTSRARSESTREDGLAAAQRSLAQQIETLLLNETPIIYAYFYDYLAATLKNVTGVYPTGQGQFFLWNAGLTS